MRRHAQPQVAASFHIDVVDEVLVCAGNDRVQRASGRFDVEPAVVADRRRHDDVAVEVMQHGRVAGAVLLPSLTGDVHAVVEVASLGVDPEVRQTGWSAVAVPCVVREVPVRRVVVMQRVVRFEAHQRDEMTGRVRASGQPGVEQDRFSGDEVVDDGPRLAGRPLDISPGAGHTVGIVVLDPPPDARRRFHVRPDLDRGLVCVGRRSHDRQAEGHDEGIARVAIQLEPPVGADHGVDRFTRPPNCDRHARLVLRAPHERVVFPPAGRLVAVTVHELVAGRQHDLGSARLARRRLHNAERCVSRRSLGTIQRDSGNPRDQTQHQRGSCPYDATGLASVARRHVTGAQTSFDILLPASHESPVVPPCP